MLVAAYPIVYAELSFKKKSYCRCGVQYNSEDLHVHKIRVALGSSGAPHF